MGELTKRNKYYWDRKLQIKCTISDHSHGYLYIYFPNNPYSFEPDLIFDKKYINFEGRFLEMTKENWDLNNNRMDHVLICKNCGHPPTFKRNLK